MKDGLIINGIKHKLVDEKIDYPCVHCSLASLCDKIREIMICIDMFDGNDDSRFVIDDEYTTTD